MKLDAITVRIEQLLLTLHTAANDGPPQLDPLFAALGATDADGAEVERQIWAIWNSHSDPAAATAMRRVSSAFETGELDAAAQTLDRMVERWPAWAEAWNKRATLRYATERDADSLDDIARTLQLEPRHFGAIGGLGQICLRAGDLGSALMAFERALAINPHLDGIRQAVVALRKQAPRTLH